jgi:dihydrofolate synthase/folylpolyglutamate synthase
MALVGRHQRANAALALVGLELLDRAGLAVSERAVRRGLAEVAWPGRLQTIGQRPRVILDGAHNPGAARVLAQALEDVRPPRGRGRLWVVIGCMADKDYRTILRTIGPAADELILTRAAYERSAKPEQLAQAAESLGLAHRVAPELLAALALARAEAGAEDVIVVTGSLFVVGEVLAGLSIPPFPEEG